MKAKWVMGLVLVLAVAGVAKAQMVKVAVDSGWEMSQRNFKIPEDHPVEHNGEIVEFLGRKSFRMARGMAWRKDVQFENGTIDVDMAADNSSRFFGIAFHVESEDQYEVIFFRPRNSGTDQAVQYTPGMYGAPVWQIYTGPGYTATADIPRNQWIHLHMVIAGLKAELYLNGSNKATLTVPDLKLGKVTGSIGFWGHLGAAYFSNLTYTPDRGSYQWPDPTFGAGTLTDWELSDVFDVTEKDPEKFPDPASLKWERVKAETPGMVVINRYRRSPNIDAPEREERIRGPVAGSKVVFARTTIRSEREQVRRMKIGYSDEVVVYLNGRPIYSGKNELGFRQGNFLGLMDEESDAVFLPLKAGSNELVLAVTEFFGGWGFICKLE